MIFIYELVTTEIVDVDVQIRIMVVLRGSNTDDVSPELNKDPDKV